MSLLSNMMLRISAALLFTICATTGAASDLPDGHSGDKRVIRIGADPNNLPFSNNRLEGFENKIAELLARELNVEIKYVWRAQRRGFFRETLKEGTCDLVLGVPARFKMALTTNPYYRSAYAFVVRDDSDLDLSSLDDPMLRNLKIGVHLVGDDGINTPPAHALAERNIITNLIGFTLYGNYTEPNPPSAIVEAVAKKEIDVAIVWGPLAGYFSGRQSPKLRVIPLLASDHPHDLPFAFDIAMGVRKKDHALRDELNEVLFRRRTEIKAILQSYGVPLETKVHPAAP